tara:strand:- start:119 stop:1021 length:903 start_codon:yes stop_codon:yes gene_type:complete
MNIADGNKLLRCRSKWFFLAVTFFLCTAASHLGAQGDISKRIVSIVPAVTEMLFEIGAGEQVVGISSFASYPNDIKSLPRVGALLDPNIERILSLKPDLVVMHNSQTDAIEQMRRGGIEVFLYRHGGISDATEMLRHLGRRTGRTIKAMMVAKQVETKLQSIRTRVSKYPKPKVLLVLGREPDTIRNVYASGGIGFLNDMVTAAGGINVFAHIQSEAVRPTAEGVLAASPDVIIEIRAEGLLSPNTTSNQPNVWDALSAIPAVQKDRVYFLTGSDLVVPGPRVAKATERLARTLHPAAFK